MKVHTTEIIHVWVIVHGKEYVIQTFPNEYPNLMLLIYDKIYPENFGDCKGIGRCGTCHIRILTPSVNLLPHDRNEKTTLARIETTGADSRLACQILITPSIDGMHVEVLNDEEPGLY